MGLKKQILSIFDERMSELSMQEIYNLFPDVKKTTVRGRVYDALGKGIIRIGKSLYISAQAIIEHGNSLEIIDRLIEEEDKFDFIFLDIPYQAGGNKGGNRDLFACDKISPEEFKIFMDKCSKLLKDEHSPVAFMFTAGRSSKAMHDKYISKIDLKQCSVIGTYQKLWGNGNPMNMGKYLMPFENIYFFTKSGKLNTENVPESINYRLTPDLKEYPTAKPYYMIKDVVKRFTKIHDWVFDPFGGSGKTLRACLELNRNCHIIDSSEIAIQNHILKIA